MTFSSLSALSPLDGRYASRLQGLAALCSESGLIKRRVQVEIAWFCALADHPGFSALPALSAQDKQFLGSLLDQFSEADAEAIKAIEARTNHDVKAVEYWLKERFSQQASLAPHAEFIHFACTSEDINNVAWGLILKEALTEQLDPLLAQLDEALATKASEYAALPMLSRTHGQTASPTTLGKELANFVFRLRRQRRQLISVEITAKINGAVGNFNAHLAACPDIDWSDLARSMIESLGLVWNPYTTQIEPHDMIAEISHALVRINTVILDLARDCWGYVSLGYFRQRLVEGEVGSSTMPHKVNPIDFENGEGNLGLANALLEHLAAKLPVSRWQRDLTDSTVQRSLGSALGYCQLAWSSILKGLDRIAADEGRIAQDLDHSWEVLAEAVQTVMRLHGLPEPYEQLKALTRGRGIDQDSIRTFIANLDLPDAVRTRLLALTPGDYTGNARLMAERLSRFV
ncbi:MAG: adenylosuccinate lyase [Wenzhouxiangella sp.]|jgi:adenylosuccinate lyase|nr:adenylosuccinate lyase [Wenzhouxiangella sp.]